MRIIPTSATCDQPFSQSINGIKSVTEIFLKAKRRTVFEENKNNEKCKYESFVVKFEGKRLFEILFETFILQYYPSKSIEIVKLHDYIYRMK